MNRTLLNAVIVALLIPVPALFLAVSASDGAETVTGAALPANKADEGHWRRPVDNP